MFSEFPWLTSSGNSPDHFGIWLAQGRLTNNRDKCTWHQGSDRKFSNFRQSHQNFRFWGHISDLKKTLINQVNSCKIWSNIVFFATHNLFEKNEQIVNFRNSIFTTIFVTFLPIGTAGKFFNFSYLPFENVHFFPFFSLFFPFVPFFPRVSDKIRTSGQFQHISEVSAHFIFIRFGPSISAHFWNFRNSIDKCNTIHYFQFFWPKIDYGSELEGSGTEGTN
jgi:hypothetical protein